MPRKFTATEIAGFDEGRRRRIAKCRRYYAENRAALREDVKAYQRAHRDQINARKKRVYDTEAAHRKYLDKMYQPGAGDYYHIQLKKQDGKCAICGRKPKGRLAQDHNNISGQLRGLLCRTHCNRALGYAREDPELLRKMADYIEWWNADAF